MGIFAWSNALVIATGVVIPDAANLIALATPGSPKKQDTAGATPATVTGQEVKRFDDVSGNGNHFVWAAGAIPTLDTDGAVIFPTGAYMTSPAAVAGTSWSLYVRQDSNTTNGLSACDPAAEGTRYIQPRYFPAGTTCYMQFGAGSVAMADGASLATRGMVAQATTTLTMIDGVESSFSGAAGITGVRLGASTYSWAGKTRAVALYTGAHDATMRASVRAYLATL